MLGVTTYITADVAAVPLLWVIPLALYLLTFVLAFTNKQFALRIGSLRSHARQFLLHRTYRSYAPRYAKFLRYNPRHH